MIHETWTSSWTSRFFKFQCIYFYFNVHLFYGINEKSLRITCYTYRNILVISYENLCTKKYVKIKKKFYDVRGRYFFNKKVSNRTEVGSKEKEMRGSNPPIVARVIKCGYDSIWWISMRRLGCQSVCGRERKKHQRWKKNRTLWLLTTEDGNRV